MKFTAVFLLAAAIHVSARTTAQTISLNEQGVSLKKVMSLIEKQSGYQFFYKQQLIGNLPPVTATYKGEALETVLKNLFKDLPIDYTIVRKSIVLKERAVGKKYPGSVTTELSQEPLPVSAPPPITVRGRVVNEKGEGVEASVQVKGTQRGVATNANGEFTINNVDGNATLVISGVNIETPVEVKVNGKAEVGEIITITKVATGLDVVIGTTYYKTTERTKTGSIVKITAKEIEQQPVTSPLMALQGRVAGLEINPLSGIPGNVQQIKIRGTNSLRFDGSYPLYVIDGVPVNSSPIASNSSSFMSGGYDPLSAINPANIESIEILKDADATSIYGARGANGVILITTKQGLITGKSSLDVSVYTGIGKVSNTLKVLNTEQYLAMRREGFANDGTVPSASNYDINGVWDQTRNTNWQQVLLGGSANITDAQTNFSGGNGNTSFRLGGGFHKETMVILGDFGYHRINGSLNINHISSNRKFRANISINYGAEKSSIFNGGFVSAALTLPPNAPSLYKDDGSLNWDYQSGVPGWTNPLSSFTKTHNATKVNLISNAVLSYELIPGLQIKTSLGYSLLDYTEILKTPISFNDPLSITPLTTGSADFGDNEGKTWIIEPQIAYNKKIGNHSLSFNGGVSLQESQYESRLINGTGYSTDALLNSIKGATTVSFSRDNFSEYRYNSLFGRTGYSFKDKYLVNLTGRRDGSSRFGPGKQFGNFGAIGTAWIFSKENIFTNNLKFVSFGKLRASLGTTGNDQIGDYRFYDTYSILYGPYQGNPTLSPTELYNPNFRWEVTTKLELSIQLGFLKDRIFTELNWYRNRSANQLVEYQLPATTGFPSILQNFPALIENKGVEFLLRTENIKSESFKWNTSVNISFPRNKLVEFEGIEYSTYATRYKVGEPLSIQRLYIYRGVNPQTGLYEFADVNNSGALDVNDRQFMNARDKKYYGGINNEFQYKSFEISFLFQFANQTSDKYIPSLPGRLGNQPVSALNRWREVGDISDIQRFSNATAAAVFANLSTSTYNIQDASFIRMKTLSLSYRLPSSLLNKLKLKSALFFIQGQNLFTITKNTNLDPETGNSLPPLRMLTTGLQIKL